MAFSEYMNFTRNHLQNLSFSDVLEDYLDLGYDLTVSDLRLNVKYSKESYLKIAVLTSLWFAANKVQTSVPSFLHNFLGGAAFLTLFRRLFCFALIW